MKYRVNVSREDYGYILIEAASEDEARGKVDTGEWSDDMYIIKNGGVTVENITEICE